MVGDQDNAVLAAMANRRMQGHYFSRRDGDSRHTTLLNMPGAAARG